MSDVIEDTLYRLYPFTTSVVTGAGAYWVTTKFPALTTVHGELPMAIAFLSAAIAYAGIDEGGS